MPQSHEERCRKYKQQIENLKLDNMELRDQLAEMNARLKKLETNGSAKRVPVTERG
jgi:benzoyl-CoA reductase/2-hydroxyglutaryl-CoA dehydratase subunit BcrC/BadD/HgdB